MDPTRSTEPSGASPASRTLRARYLYAVLPGEGPWSPFTVDGTPVEVIPAAGMRAVVSPCVPGKVRPERRKLALHHQVLAQLAAQYTLLPVAFGMVAESPAQVNQFLTHNRQALAEQLERVRHRIEMGLRVAWDTEDLIAYFLERHPDLRAMRDHMFRDGRAPSTDEKLGLGRQFDQTVEALRERLTHSILELLGPHCVETAEDPIRDPREIGRFSFLIERDQRSAFEEVVLQAAQSFDDTHLFDLNGPWPPHHFVELELEDPDDDDDDDEEEEDDDDDDDE